MVLTPGGGAWPAAGAGSFFKGKAPAEFIFEGGLVNKLLVTALLVVFLALAPGATPAAAQMVEYGGLVSQNQAGGRLGASLNHKFQSVRTRQRTPRQSKARR
jgi:hypothetical protein